MFKAIEIGIKLGMHFFFKKNPFMSAEQRNSNHMRWLEISTLAAVTVGMYGFFFCTINLLLISL